MGEVLGDPVGDGVVVGVALTAVVGVTAAFGVALVAVGPDAPQAVAAKAATTVAAAPLLPIVNLPMPVVARESERRDRCLVTGNPCAVWLHFEK